MWIALIEINTWIRSLSSFMKFIYFNQKYFSESPSYQENGKVLLIPEPWLIFSNKLKRYLCHIHLSPRLNSKFELPGKSIWVRDILKKTGYDNNDVCIILNAHFYNLFYGNLFREAKRLFRKVYFVFIFSDRVSYFKKQYMDFPDVEILKKEFDLVLTYNTYDSEKYGLMLDRPCFPNYSSSSDILEDFESDLFFVGKDKGRLSSLYNVYEICKKNGIKCDFHINDVPIEKQKYTDDIFFNKSISYQEVLERARKTKCILNIVQENGEGVTLRDYETISLNKLALTNNKALLQTGLYTKEQIIWLDEILDRINEIKSGYQGTNNLAKEFSQGRWFDWLEYILENTDGLESM